VHISCSGQTCRWRVRPGTTGSLPLPPRALLAPAARHAPPPIIVVETPVVSSTTRRARPKPSSAARAHDSTLTPIGSAKGAATRAATATRRRHAPPRDPLRKGSTAALGGAGTRAPAFVLTAGRPTAALAATLARRTARRFRSGQGTFAHRARTGRTAATEHHPAVVRRPEIGLLSLWWRDGAVVAGAPAALVGIAVHPGPDVVVIIADALITNAKEGGGVQQTNRKNARPTAQHRTRRQQGQKKQTKTRKSDDTATNKQSTHDRGSPSRTSPDHAATGVMPRGLKMSAAPHALGRSRATGQGPPSE
jgi:hypothetical protein